MNLIEVMAMMAMMAVAKMVAMKRNTLMLLMMAFGLIQPQVTSF